ncbi:FMN-binding protein [Aquiluna sp.]|nr:FMN-binding protein [Aquiluna sp.]
MRISTSIVSVMVAGGSMSFALQHAANQQSDWVPIELSLAESAVTSKPGSEPSPSKSATTKPAPDSGAPQNSSVPTQVSTQDTSAPGANRATQSDSNPPADPTPAAAAQPTAEPAPQPVSKTVVSDVISYKYGKIQISLTATSQDITGIELLLGDASYGRDVAYAALIDATVQLDGTGYGNVSGATFTTEAFKKAVSNALSKL